MTLEKLLEQEHAFTPDGKKLYLENGDIYRICYDYHFPDEITDFTLINDYSELSGAENE